MIITTFKCDRCDHQQDNGEQMWNVGISFSHHNSASHYPSAPTKEQLWCRECMEKMGLLGPYQAPPQKHDPAPPPAPTLEEIIREIARREVTQMTGAA